jgi:hypothetical protein
MILHKRERPLGYPGFKIMQNGHPDYFFINSFDLAKSHYCPILIDQGTVFDLQIK